MSATGDVSSLHEADVRKPPINVRFLDKSRRGRGNGGIIHSQGKFFAQLSRESNLKIGSLFLQFFADPSENSGTVMIDALVGELPTVVSKIA
jgi:hypothetical protein